MRVWFFLDSTFIEQVGTWLNPIAKSGIALKLTPCYFSNEGVKPPCCGDEVMVRPRRIARFLFYLVACVLMCAAFASEIPEQLTLTNDTSNDYTLQSPSFLENVRILSAPRKIVVLAPPPSWHSFSTLPEDRSVQAQGLYSVLRT